MPQLPASINGATTEFSSTVNKTVDQKIIDALKHCIKPNIAKGYVLMKIYISFANDSHTMPSRHVQGLGKAVDISRIDGLKMSLHYKTNVTVSEITKAIQNEFESYIHKRENFGPLLKNMLGRPRPVSGHGDHIHSAVN